MPLTDTGEGDSLQQDRGGKGLIASGQGGSEARTRLPGYALALMLGCVLAGCSTQNSQSKLDAGEAVALLPAPAKPGQADPAAPTEPQAGASTAETEAASSGETVEISIDRIGLREAVGLAIARHPDVSRAQAIVAQSESEVAIAKSAWYPTLEYGVNPQYNRDTGGQGAQEASASLGVNQLVYDFGRSRSQISVASATLEKERFLLADTIENIAYSTASTFIDLAASQETIAAADRQVNSLRETKDKIETRVKAGLSDASDLNQAEVAIQRAAAEALTARTEYDVAAGKLAEVAGVRPGRVQDLTTTSVLLQGLNAAAPDAIEQTPAVLAAQAAANAAAANVKLAKAERFPSIGINAGKSISTNRDFFTGEREQETWVGLRLSGNVSLGGLHKHQISSAEAEQRAENQSLENQRLVTRTALGSAETEAAGAAARLQSYQSVIDLSRSLIDLYWQQYTLDKRPLTDVINAERDVYQSEVARINAVADGNRARIKATAAVGTFVAQLKAGKSSSK